MEAVESSFPHWARNDKATAQFHGKRHLLYNKDGVIMSNDRIFIPRSLRKRVLQLLHGAHHGVTSMGAWVRNLVYWSGPPALPNLQQDSAVTTPDLHAQLSGAVDAL